MKIEANKKNISIIAVYAIIEIVYAVVFLALPVFKTPANLIMFIFTLVSIGISCTVCLYVFGKEGALKSKVYGFPVFRLAYIYPLVQFGLSVVIGLISLIVYVPFFVALVASVILLGVALVGLIATENVKDIVEETENEVERATKAVKLFTLNIASAVDLCPDEKAKKELLKLSEDFRFSDPVSSEATEEIEMEIMHKLEALTLSIPKMTGEEISAEAVKLKVLLAERNRICKMNK